MSTSLKDNLVEMEERVARHNAAFLELAWSEDPDEQAEIHAQMKALKKYCKVDLFNF